MAKTREIKKRIKAVSNIRRITKTMQMIATSKFARAQQRATATKPYTEGVFGLVTELAATAGSLDHPLVGSSGGSGGAGKDKSKPAAPMLSLVLTSDRGLCGAYNGSVLRTAMVHLRAGREARGVLDNIELVGRKGAGFLRYNSVPVAKQHAVGDKFTYADIERIAQSYMDRFIAGEIAGVTVIYMRFISAGRQSPEVLQLLPLKPPEAKKGEAAAGPKALYEFSPSERELLDDLLPAAVKATLFQCFNDAIVSEHVSRMVAMKAATDNAGKARKSLTRDYNRARQSQITTELTEIVSGAAALG